MTRSFPLILALMSIGELFAARSRIWQDRIRTVARYYKSPRFALVDLAFGIMGLFSNPYRTCRKFLQKRGERNVYAYGETPLATLEKIARECEIERGDRWLELGSGRGKGCFWMAHFVGCETTGVEWVPEFVWFANALRVLFRVKGLSFKKINIDEADFSSATAVYLYGTCMEDSQIKTLVDKMALLPRGAKLISVSEPVQGGEFIVRKSFKVDFPWGRTRAYLQIKS